MAEAYYLTEADLAVLREMIEDWRGRPTGDPVRDEPPADALPPEVYVVKTPASYGIPGRVGTSPGRVQCQTYRLINSVLVGASAGDRVVHNLNEDDLPGSQWVLALRDKFGTWWTDGTPAEVGTGTGTGDGGSGGSGTDTLGTIREVDGTPSYTDVSLIELDQADGFVLSQPAANRARIDLADASATQRGIMNIDTSAVQEFIGTKRFRYPVFVNTDNLGPTPGGGGGNYAFVVESGSGSYGAQAAAAPTWLIGCAFDEPSASVYRQILYLNQGTVFPGNSTVGSPSQNDRSLGGVSTFSVVCGGPLYVPSGGHLGATPESALGDWYGFGGIRLGTINGYMASICGQGDNSSGPGSIPARICLGFSAQLTSQVVPAAEVVISSTNTQLELRNNHLGDGQVGLLVLGSATTEQASYCIYNTSVGLRKGTWTTVDGYTIQGGIVTAANPSGLTGSYP